MASEQQLRDVRMACLFGDEFRQPENLTSNEGNATLLDILRPGLEAQRAQVIANLNGHGGDQNRNQMPKKPTCKEDVASDGSIDDMVSIASIYDFIDKEYDSIQQYSGAFTGTESNTDLYRGRSSSTTRSAYTDTYSTTSYAGTASVFSGSADSAIGMDKTNGSKSAQRVPECRSDMMLWKDLDIGEGMGVVCMPNGNVAISDFETHNIIVYNDLGIRVSSSLEGGLKLSCPRGLAFHPQESGLLVAEWTKGRLLMLSADARKRLRRINVSMRPFGVAVLSGGDLVVVGMFKLHGTWSGGAAIIDVKGKEKKRWRGGLDKPWHVVVGPRDLIYVSDFRSHCILVFNAEGRKVRCIKGGPCDELTFPKGLCLLNDLILVSHDITSVSGGKASRLTAWTRHGRYIGIVLNWPAQGGCRLRGIAVHGDVLVAVGNYKVMTYKLTFRDVIRMSVSSKASNTEVDIIYDELILRSQQQSLQSHNRIALMNNQNINASKVQRVMPFVRSPCDTISENEDHPKKDLQIPSPEKRAESVEFGGSVLLATPQPYAPPINVAPLQDNPNVIYQRGIKYFRGYTSGRKTTYNPIYSPADIQQTINPTPDLSDHQEDQHACIDFDAGTPDVRKSQICFSRGSFYSSQPNLNSPDPWVYQSQSSIATRSEPYSPCYYDMKPCSPAYIDLRYVRHTALPRSPFDVTDAHMQQQPNKHQDGTHPHHVQGMPMQPAQMRRHLLSPSAHFLPPTVEVEDQHPIDIITELYDDILKMDDEETTCEEQLQVDIEPTIEMTKECDGETQTACDELKDTNFHMTPSHVLSAVVHEGTRENEERDGNANAEKDRPQADQSTLINEKTQMPAKPFIPAPPPLIGKVLHPSQRKKMEDAKIVAEAGSGHANNQLIPKSISPPVPKPGAEACTGHANNQLIPKPIPPPVPKPVAEACTGYANNQPSPNATLPPVPKPVAEASTGYTNNQLSPKPTPPPVAKKPQVDKARLKMRRSMSISKSSAEKFVQESQLPQVMSPNYQSGNEEDEDGIVESDDSDVNIDIQKLNEVLRGFSQAILDSKHYEVKVEQVKLPNSQPVDRNSCAHDVVMSSTHRTAPQEQHINPKESKVYKTDEPDNLETTRRLLSYTPSSPAQALAKIMKASVAKPAWEIDTTDDERVNSVLDSFYETEDDEIEEDKLKAQLDAIIHDCQHEQSIARSVIPDDRPCDEGDDQLQSNSHNQTEPGLQEDTINGIEYGNEETENTVMVNDVCPIDEMCFLETDVEETDRKLTSPGNTIQRGKPNTYNEKPVVHRTRTVSPQRVDSFEVSYLQNGEKLEISNEYPVTSTPDFPPPPSPASLEPYPDLTRRLLISPVVPCLPSSKCTGSGLALLTSENSTEKRVEESPRDVASPVRADRQPSLLPKLPEPSLPTHEKSAAGESHTQRRFISQVVPDPKASMPQASDTTKPPCGKSVRSKTDGVTRNETPAPNHPPPPPITYDERFLPTPDLPPPPLPVLTDMFLTKMHCKNDAKDQGIPIARVVNKPCKDNSPFTPQHPVEKHPKTKPPKTADQNGKRKNFSVLHNIIRKAFNHKNGNRDNGRGCVVFPEENENARKDTSALKSSFRHSFCHSRTNNQAEKPAHTKNSADVSKAETKTQNEKVGQKKRSSFQRRNTICGVSVLKANPANAAKGTGGLVPHSEV